MDRPCFVYEERQPLWLQIQSFLKPQEKNEVRLILGENVIARNEMLHEEAKTLATIVMDLRRANDADAINGRGKTIVVSEEAGEVPSLGALPEPPAKQLLKQQILFFVNNLSSLRGDADRDSEDLLSSVPSTPREERLLAGIIGNQKHSSPGSSVLSRPGSSPGSFRFSRSSSRTATHPTHPTHPGRCGRDSRLVGENSRHRPHPDTSSTRPVSSSMSTRSAPAGPLDNMEKFLNIFEIERVIKDLKSSFETEYKDLMEDVEYLNASLDEEHNYTLFLNDSSKKREDDASAPTLQELRNVSAKLEKTWLEAEVGSLGEGNSTKLTTIASKSKLEPLSMQNAPGIENDVLHTAASTEGERQVVLPRKTSRIRKRFQQAKLEDSDSKFFV